MPDTHIISPNLPATADEWARHPERISISPDTPVGTMQVHLCRYLFALKYCVGKRVLDAGCGTAYGSVLLHRISKEVVALDNSPEAYWAARSAYGWNIIQCSIEDFLPGNLFDVVVALEVVEHLQSLTTGLEKLRSFIHQDGLLLCSLPIRQPFNPWHHGRDYSEADWYEIIDAHFSIEEKYYQPLEGASPGQSNCTILPAPDHFPNSGVVLYIARRREDD